MGKNSKVSRLLLQLNLVKGSLEVQFGENRTTDKLMVSAPPIVMGGAENFVLNYGGGTIST